MLLVESKEKLKELKERFEDVQLSLGTNALERELEEIDKKMAESDFWSDGEKAKSLTQRRKVLEENIKALKSVERSLRDVEELLEIISEDDLESLQMIEEELKTAEKLIEELEIKVFLSGEMDQKNAYLTVQAGAGGVEACDWAEMLFRMYRRWAEKKG
ncbi:PCRF domain-containing protein, partial [Thermocrinis sp.]|uniref:PCRF domain-containing protein n=1 Tax=Thermocrinis sp. TaxID=2024383 RepID=UPI003C0E4757